MLALLYTLVLSRECRTITRCPHKRRVCPDHKKLKITICGAKVRTPEKPQIQEEMNAEQRPPRHIILPEEQNPQAFQKVVHGVECLLQSGSKGHSDCPYADPVLEENVVDRCKVKHGRWVCEDLYSW